MLYYCIIKYREGDTAVDIQVGDRLEMRKPHPCGSHTFEVLRIGMDFRLRCVGCGREFLAPGLKIEKRIKTVHR